ncbi:MAG: DMT family transporter [Pseudomonadales bacterium]|nr:DMT family transporter [Pseudomonadales bacterium]
MTNWLSNTLVLSTILFIAGIGIPIMASLNSGLGARLESPIAAAFVLFLLALAVTAALLLMNPLPSSNQLMEIPAPFYLGGFFVAFYVLSITWIAPKIGLGNAIFLVLFGQIVAAAIIDHHGLFYVPKTPITAVRIVGIGLMGLGLYMAKKPPIVM